MKEDNENKKDEVFQIRVLKQTKEDYNAIADRYNLTSKQLLEIMTKHFALLSTDAFFEIYKKSLEK